MKALNFRKTMRMAAAGALVAVGALVAADMAWSQPDGGRRGRLGRGGGPGGPGGGVLAIPLGLLGLSEEQREAVRGVLAESRGTLREARERVQASRQALRDAVGTGGDLDEDAIRSAAAELGTAEGAVALARASARARIWQGLTPEQRTAADVLRAAREQRMDERRARFEERRERLVERRERWEERRERWEERREQRRRPRDRWEGRRGRGQD